MKFATRAAPHLAPGNSVQRMMVLVLLALLPGIAAYCAYFGPGLLVQIALAAVTALAIEAAMVNARGRPVRVALADGSALVTAVLLALCLPPLAPWWLTVVGTGFAMVFGKHLYGGLGYNPFNPAMLGYVVLLVSFPAPLSRWIAPEAGLSFSDTLTAIFLPGALPGVVDAVTSATPLDLVRTELARSLTFAEAIADPRLGSPAWTVIGAAFAAGGMLLLATRVIRWHTPVAMLATLMLLAAMFHGGDAGRYPDAWFHLTSGATLLGAFFIVTDPVTAAASNAGRLWYGAGIGALVWVIRTLGGYPDGVAFAVLLMNAAVPLIDHWTRPRAYGEPR